MTEILDLIGEDLQRAASRHVERHQPQQRMRRPSAPPQPLVGGGNRARMLAAGVAVAGLAAVLLIVLAPAPRHIGSRITSRAAILAVFRHVGASGPPFPPGFLHAYAPDEPAGEKFGLAPALSVYVATGSAPGVWLTPGTRGVCIVAKETDGGAGGSCATNAQTRLGALRVEITTATGQPTAIFGVAPDGTTGVDVTYADGATRSAPVVENVYSVPHPSTATTVTVPIRGGQATTWTIGPDGSWTITPAAG